MRKKWATQQSVGLKISDVGYNQNEILGVQLAADRLRCQRQEIVAGGFLNRTNKKQAAKNPPAANRSPC